MLKMPCDPELKNTLAIGFKLVVVFILSNLTVCIAMRVDGAHIFRPMLLSPLGSDKKEIVLMA